MVQQHLIVHRLWTQAVCHIQRQRRWKRLGSDFRRGCCYNMMKMIRPFTVTTEKHSKVTMRISERKCPFIVTNVCSMAQPTCEKESPGQDEDLLVVSQERRELSVEDLQENSGSQEHIPDGNVNETETKQDRCMENWLEDGLGNLFEESQSSKEGSTRKPGKSKQVKSPVDRGIIDHTEDGPSKSKKKKRRASKAAETPDHFIALQISNPKIQKGFADIQEKIISQSSPLKDAMVSVKKLHVTVMPVCLPTPDRIDRAKTALEVSAARLSADYRDRLVVLGVAGLGHFRNSVLFAKVTPSDPTQHDVLQNISDVVNDSFAENEIINTDKRSDFKPHITIAKMSKNFRKLRQKGIKKIDPSLYEDEVDRHFGHQVLTTVQLCSMFKQDKVTGYYKILQEASFGPREISKMTIEQQFTVTSAADILVQWSVKSAMDRCLAVSHSAGDKTSNIKSEESRQPETDHLTDLCEDEHCTVHQVKLDTESDLCTTSVKDSTATLDINDSKTYQIDSVSKEEVVSVSAKMSEEESSPDGSSNVKDCPDGSSNVKDCPDGSSNVKDCPDGSSNVKDCPDGSSDVKDCPDGSSDVKDCPDGSSDVKDCPDGSSDVKDCPDGSSDVKDCPDGSSDVKDCPDGSSDVKDCPDGSSDVKDCPDGSSDVKDCPDGSSDVKDCPDGSSDVKDCPDGSSDVKDCPDGSSDVKDCPDGSSDVKDCPDGSSDVKDCPDGSSDVKDCPDGSSDVKDCPDGSSDVKDCPDGSSDVKDCPDGSSDVKDCPDGSSDVKDCPDGSSDVKDCPDGSSDVKDCPDGSSDVKDCPDGSSDVKD
ncbi:uncharacterized protein LOC110466107 isoform X2 [Mizuhopecten yessoensis]|uniref:uncharacterized protein LOC110466107 isoform X2 n=1 Tax=Mizuhopecten yessoensis TaxID=6573 RepID=UPI000B45B792|nr:uncharacterized protein LOC110466107 isoform X2 [Mizuhopecten yessoensis]